MKRDRRRRTSARGAGLVEFLIVIPVLILVGVGMFNIGRVVLQVQVLADAAKIGARSAVRHAGRVTTADCSALATVGLTAAASYRDATDKWQLNNLWKACVTFTGRNDWTYGSAMNYRAIRVFFVPRDSAENCLFCAAGMLRFIDATPDAIFDMTQNSACISDSSFTGELCEP